MGHFHLDGSESSVAAVGSGRRNDSSGWCCVLLCVGFENTGLFGLDFLLILLTLDIIAMKDLQRDFKVLYLSNY
jgi:hypothetical protein